MGVDNVRAAYEDIFYFLWTEGQLPDNIDPLKANLKDPLERRTLAQLLNAGLDTPIEAVGGRHASRPPSNSASCPSGSNVRLSEAMAR